MYRRLIALFAMVMLAAMVMAVPAQAASDWQTTTFPITDAKYNTCNGDIVVINGKLTTRTRITNSTHSGFLRFELRESMSGTGVSDTGASYKFSSSSRDEFQVKEQRYVYTQQTYNILLDKVGTTGSDLRVRWSVTKMTDTQTGETTVVKDDYQAVCR
jgi:hypothetical protein